MGPEPYIYPCPYGPGPNGPGPMGPGLAPGPFAMARTVCFSKTLQLLKRMRSLCVCGCVLRVFRVLTKMLLGLRKKAPRKGYRKEQTDTQKNKETRTWNNQKPRTWKQNEQSCIRNQIIQMMEWEQKKEWTEDVNTDEQPWNRKHAKTE